MSTPFGQALRRWRRQRGLSQLELALQACTSPRHVSFLETGRSRPGDAMVLRLAEALDLPLRERNDLLRQAGFAPAYPERGLEAAAVAPYWDIVQRMIAQHEPFPAFVVDRWWEILATNQGAAALLPAEEDADFVDILDGPMRQVLENWLEIAWFGLYRLRREVAAAGPDERLGAMLARLEAMLAGTIPPPISPDSPTVCVRVRAGGRTLRFVSTIARFGSCVDVTLSELRVELMYPADDETDALFRAMIRTQPA